MTNGVWPAATRVVAGASPTYRADSSQTRRWLLLTRLAQRLKAAMETQKESLTENPTKKQNQKKRKTNDYKRESKENQNEIRMNV
jgi:hypothetical protein